MRLSRRPSRRLVRDDKGITLVELLVTITLLIIIIVPLTNAMIAYLRNTDAINDRLAASHDAQLAAAFFAQDVQNIGVRDWDAEGFPLKQSVEQNVAPDGGLHPCGPSGGPNALIRMASDDPSTTATDRPAVVVVSYVVIGSKLHRWRCGTGFQDTVVAHNLHGAPTVTCCSEYISMELNLRVAGSTDLLTVKLAGQRRQTQP